MSEVQEALKAAIDTLEIEGCGGGDAAELCRSALSDLEKCEPVAKVLFRQDEDGLEPLVFYSNDEYPSNSELKDRFVVMDVYLSPISKEWVGLSDGELGEITRAWAIDIERTPRTLANAIEAKLKQLNAPDKG